MENIMRARCEATLWWEAGAAVFCPHLNSAWMGGLVPDEQFLEADLLFLRLCNLVVVVPGSLDSKGAAQEINAAKHLHIPIAYRTWGRIAWTLGSGTVTKTIEGVAEARDLCRSIEASQVVPEPPSSSPTTADMTSPPAVGSEG
jgi:hypothetical protein